MRHYTGDPYWTLAKYPGTCRSCKAEINRGNRIFYYPKGRHTYCEICGETRYHDFIAGAQDEEIYSRQY